MTEFDLRDSSDAIFPITLAPFARDLFIVTWADVNYVWECGLAARGTRDGGADSHLRCRSVLGLSASHVKQMALWETYRQLLHGSTLERTRFMPTVTARSGRGCLWSRGAQLLFRRSWVGVFWLRSASAEEAEDEACTWDLPPPLGVMGKPGLDSMRCLWLFFS